MLYLLLLVPIAIGICFYIFSFKQVRILALGLQSIVFAFTLYIFLHVSGLETPLTEAIGNWGPLSIQLYCDRVVSVFLMLTAMLFLSFFTFVQRKDYFNRLFIFLFATLQSLIMLIFLSADLFNIFVAVEISTVICGILIMYKHDSRSLYDGLVYLMTNIVGMLFFLLGIGFLYRHFGTLNIYQMAAYMRDASGKDVLLPFAFIMTGVGLKCALMPVFSWLPKAHGPPGAPSIVSAVLSALYVKGGIYLFLRMRDMFAPAIEMDGFFLAMGIITGMAGWIIAVSQKDIKLILAYHTISQLGLILIGISLGGASQWGAVYHIVNHAVFKSLLFLGAGMIVDTYHTRNIYKIRGVFRTMPVVSIATMAAILGITGAPLFNGSISKYLIQSGEINRAAEIAILLINGGTILSFVKYSHIFFGNPEEPVVSSIPIIQKGVVIGLGVLCLAGGVWGTGFIRLLFGYAPNISPLSYVWKCLIWIVSLALGYILYTMVLTKWNKIHQGFSIELTFNQICASIAGLFAVLLAYGWLTAA